MATFYIEVDTYYQNAPSFFVGPFASRAAATAWVDGIPTVANIWLSTSLCGGDIRSAWRVYPTPLSTTKAHGMRSENSDSTYSNVIDVDGYDLDSAVMTVRGEI